MIEQELAVIDNRISDHSIKDHIPKVSVFTDSAQPSLSTVAVKRHRYIQNLKNNHQKLIEALAFVERFAVVCELSDERLAAIRNAKDAAVDELAIKYQDKLKAYDVRIKESQV